MEKTVGWIGVGSMGSRMAANLSRSGHPMIVADKVNTDQVPKMATIAGNNTDVAAEAETVILSVPSGSDTLSIADEFITANDRKVNMVIDTSTIGIQHARDAAEKLAAHGITYVDAPVSGGIAGAEAATLAVMVSCSAEVFQQICPLLECIGRNVFHVGTEPGQGQTVKLLNNFLSATAMAATSEAMAFGTANGLDMQSVLDIVNVASGRNTATTDKFPNRIVNGTYDGGFAAAMMAKDVRLYSDCVEDTGTAGRIGRLVAEIFARLDEAEPGADFTRIYPFTRDGQTA